MGKKVLIAVDESEESVHALHWALDSSVVQQSDEVVLFHAQPHPRIYAAPAGPGGFFVAPELLASIEKHNKQTSEVVVEKAKNICEEKQINATVMVGVGDAREAICETVEKLHADVLVMGSHGYGAVKRVFLGSVSDYCVHNAKCSVLIVKKK
ncbi:hypothetical protein O6H91_03G018100 [Diphasiastrum complanatum]|uniref:Uncharacterized protein n=1 Tax=Diphasiastrum complanatum TaxID=34168 RepID=A0ACC2E3Y4_DIPCM|nr:hypothetical protein O6H91_03G018100 [Diphasiastrum complanatum]